MTPTGRAFVCSAKYRPLIESAIALALADAGRDEKRRGWGDAPTVQPPLIDTKARGQIVVTVAIIDAEQQEQDLNWPGEPAETERAEIVAAARA